MTNDNGKFYFDSAAADRVCDFFRECLRHSKGQWAGQPFELLEWQREKIIRPLFGWKRADGTRKYRKGYVEVSKKNGKSTLAAGIILYLLCADQEAGAEIYTAASDKEQAGIIYREAESMVKSSAILSKRLTRITSRKTITYSEKNSYFRALSKETRVAEGLNIHGLVFDELHVQRDRVLWDTLVYGGAARRQPLIFAITTAGEYDPESIGWEMHKYAEDCLSGMIEDDSFFAFIAAADKDDDWQDPQVWKKANPSYGITITPDNFVEAVQEAKNQPAKLNSFLRYRLGIWTAAEERWIDPEKWKECGKLPVDREKLKGRPCWGGLDKSTTEDVSAFVLVFPPHSELEQDELDNLKVIYVEKELDASEVGIPESILKKLEDGGYIQKTEKKNDDSKCFAVTKKGVNELQNATIFSLLCWFWIPQEAMMKRVKRDGVPYDRWTQQGFVNATPGDVIDAAQIESDILEIGKQFLIQEIAYDPWNCTELALRLQDTHGYAMIEFRQGMASFAEPTKEFEKLYCAGELAHGNNPVLNWMAGNVSCYYDQNENYKPIKMAKKGQKTSNRTARIDGIVAAIMGLGRAKLGESGSYTYTGLFG